MQWKPAQAAATTPTAYIVGSKRAIRRAAGRAQADGGTWYKGKWLTARHLGHINTACTQRAQTGSQRRGPRGGTKESARLRLLSLNVGSLSTLLWQELKEFLLTAPHDIICLQETHWSTSSEFTVHGWRAVHSGSKARADGVLTLFHPRHKADTIRHEEIQQGRVLRTQLQTPQGRVEVFNCYQFPHNFTINPTVLRDKRHALLNKLGRAVAGIPLRATLIIAGDFQAEVKPAAPHVGRSTCNTPFHTGVDALDPDALNTFLESHGLTALNTWCGPPKPTQFNQAPNKKIGTSQIDFIITRLHTADTQARRVNVSKPPIGTWRLHIGHFGLEANLRVMNHYLLPARKAVTVPIDNTGLDAAARGQDPRAQQLRDAVAERVEQCIASSPDGCTDVNQVLIQACQETFPATAKPPAPQNEIVQHLWRLRAQARYTAVQARRTGRLFAAWKAAIRYHLAAKKATKACHAKKRQEILDLLQITEDAAQQGDQRKVYQMVKKLAPWAPRNRVLLKDDNGKLTTKKEEHECLVSFSKALFAPQTEQPHREQEVLPLVFTLEEVRHELQITQVGKAVPPGVAPAAAWRISADLVAPLLQQAFAQHATLNAVLPERWTDAWIVWLPKPGKAPSNPAALRPIGLMSPEAKTLAAIIRNRLLEHIRPQLAWVPQFAYLPQRDITDALARVHSWMRKYDQVIAKAAPGRFALRARVEAGTQNELCVGGAILSLDLKQAFDRVNRQALVQALRRLQAPEDLVAAVIALHDTSAYHIHDNFSETKVTTTRGIRQGCKLAPLLWVAISTAILHELGPALSGPHKQATTFADDTLCQWLIETEQDVHDFARFLAHLLQVMRQLGLHVNLTKTSLLLKARGTGAQRALRQHIVRKDGARWWRVEMADGPALIPLAKSVIYLGTYLTLGNCALPGVKHRLQEAKGREAKIYRAVRSRRILSLNHRLRIWRACAVSSATFGLTPFGMTYPAATLLRGWFYKQLRAVTNTPAHLSHVSNAALSNKHAIPDPVDQLEQSIRHKRDKLQNKENDITNTTDIQQFWEQTHLAYKDLTTTTLQDTPVVPVTPTITGLACPECGVYFPSTKTLRQHLALKHKKLVTIDPDEAKNYQPHQHSINGVPQCKHCKKNLQTWGALRQHVLTYACRPRVSQQATPPPHTPNSPTEGEPHSAPVNTTPYKCPPEAQERWEGEAHTRQEALSAPASASAPEPPQDLPVLRRPENKHALLTPPVALTTLHVWAKELNTHCGFCNQWIARNGSVKEHIKRMHPAIWDACLDSFDRDCSHYRDIIQRDRDCELCDQKVHTADRHMRNCVVLFQVAVASAWHRAGAPEHSEITQVTPSMFTAQMVKKLLEEPTSPAPQEDKPLLTFLERHCALCSQAVVNQQDWRRHMKKSHDLEWISAQADITSTLENIELSRPCKFCRVAYTKTPRLHTTKCLPLLQLSFLRHHVRNLSSNVGSCQHLGRPQPDERGSVGRRTPADQVSQESRKGSRQIGKTAPGAAGGPAQRTEASAPPHASQNDGKARDSAPATGGRQILGDLRRLWKPGNHQPADADNSHVECSCSLRQALMGAMLMELEARMVKLETDTSAQTPLVRAKILLQDPLRWQYTKWNSDQKAHEPTSGAPLTHTTALTALRELKSLILQEGTMHAFHAMGGMSEEKEGVTLFKLTLSMESPAKASIREILTQFTESSLLRLIGARLRPERSHRPLPKELQQLLRPEQ